MRPRDAVREQRGPEVAAAQPGGPSPRRPPTACVARRRRRSHWATPPLCTGPGTAGAQVPAEGPLGPPPPNSATPPAPSPGVGLLAGPQRPLTGTLAARQVHAAGWHVPAPRVPRGARARPPGTPVRLCGTSSAASPQQAAGARPAPGALWGSTAAPLHKDDRRRRGGPGLWAPSHGDGRAPPPETRTGPGPRDSEWLRGGLTRLLSGARPWP